LDLATRQAQTRVSKARAGLKASEGEYAKQKKYQTTLQRGLEPAQRLGNTVAYLTNLAPAGIWVTGVNAERGKPISMQGTALNSDAFTAYLQALNSSDRLRNVAMVFTNNAEIQKQPVQQFSLTAFPIGNLPLADPFVKSKKGTKK